MQLEKGHVQCLQHLSSKCSDESFISLPFCKVTAENVVPSSVVDAMMSPTTMIPSLTIASVH